MKAQTKKINAAETLQNKVEEKSQKTEQRQSNGNRGEKIKVEKILGNLTYK